MIRLSTACLGLKNLPPYIPIGKMGNWTVHPITKDRLFFGDTAAFEACKKSIALSTQRIRDSYKVATEFRSELEEMGFEDWCTAIGGFSNRPFFGVLTRDLDGVLDGLTKNLTKREELGNHAYDIVTAAREYQRAYRREEQLTGMEEFKEDLRSYPLGERMERVFGPWGHQTKEEAAAHVRFLDYIRR